VKKSKRGYIQKILVVHFGQFVQNCKRSRNYIPVRHLKSN